MSAVAIDDDLWSAIGDPTRRRMLDLLLADGGGTATTLSDQLPVTRQAVAKHLGVLDRVGLVHGTPAGPRAALRGRRGPARARGRPAVARSAPPGTPACSRIKRIAEAIQRSQDATAATTRQRERA